MARGAYRTHPRWITHRYGKAGQRMETRFIFRKKFWLLFQMNKSGANRMKTLERNGETNNNKKRKNQKQMQRAQRKREREPSKARWQRKRYRTLIRHWLFIFYFYFLWYAAKYSFDVTCTPFEIERKYRWRSFLPFHIWLNGTISNTLYKHTWNTNMHEIWNVKNRVRKKKEYWTCGDRWIWICFFLLLLMLPIFISFMRRPCTPINTIRKVWQLKSEKNTSIRWYHGISYAYCTYISASGFQLNRSNRI